MPFDNRVVTIELEGRRLLELRDFTSGDRPVVNRHLIDPDLTYRLATTDYLVGTWRDRGAILDASDEGILLRNLFIGWISELGVIP